MSVSRLPAARPWSSLPTNSHADAVAEGGAQHTALMLDLLVGGLDELEERDDVNTEVAIAQPLSDVGQPVLPGVVQMEHAHDPRERFARDDMLRGDRRLPVLRARMRPARHLDTRRALDAII